MTEKAFQRMEIDLARLHGWRVAHFRPCRTQHGWRTSVSADGKGFPDLVLVRERLLFVELKTDTGIMTAEQLAWLAALRAAGQDARVWRPADWSIIEATLTREDVS